MDGLKGDVEARLRALDGFAAAMAWIVPDLRALVGRNTQDLALLRQVVDATGTAATATLVQPVTGCNGTLPTAGTISVSLFDSTPTLIATATNDGFGNATFSGLAAGTYTTTAQGAGGAAGRWAAPATSGSITVAGTGTTTAPTLNMGAAATGYLCWDPCPVPIKDTLSVADSNGTHLGLLTYVPGYVGGLQYLGCYTKSISNGANPVVHVGCTTATVTAPLEFALIHPNGVLGADLVIATVVCDSTNYQPTQAACGATSNYSEYPSTASFQCWPFLITYHGIDFPNAGSAGASLLSTATNIVVTE
ncbi:MAG TPA: hypothetical protein VG406_02930 [Isosphaeraceae bacterium]|jgi:hypothetical protein|nr:hypothetical protein [Isosphaeraceae bacterium]